MRVKLLVLTAFLATAFAPTVAAAPACDAVTEATPDLGGWYVVVTTGESQVWHEDNGVAGLQRVACVDGEGVERPADFRNATMAHPNPNDLPCRVQGRWIVCYG